MLASSIAKLSITVTTHTNLRFAQGKINKILNQVFLFTTEGFHFTVGKYIIIEKL